jgi:hypothetical protein
VPALRSGGVASMIRFVLAHRKTVRAATAVLAIAVQLTACGASGSATGPVGSRSSRPDSGIHGRVVLGPTCPVQRIGQTCTRPYRALISIRARATGRLVARVHSSASGRFTIALAPGRYLLVPRSGNPYPRSSPEATTVREDRYTKVIIQYDTGIR